MAIPSTWTITAPRGVPTTHYHPRDWAGNCDSAGGGDRQWGCVPKRARPGRLGRDGTQRVHHRRPTEIDGHQQTRQFVSSEIIRPRSARRHAASQPPDQFTGPLVSSTDSPHPPKCSDCRACEQTTAGGVGSLTAQRTVSICGFGHLVLIQGPAPFPSPPMFQNGPRRPGFASPRKNRAPWTAAGRSENRL